jgi:hypothetical protein
LDHDCARGGAAAWPGRALLPGLRGLVHANLDQHPQILEAYSQQLPAFAVAPHLAAIVRDRFRRPARVVPPALEPMWRPRWRWRPAQRPRVVVAHPFEVDWKGVATALEAVRRLRAGGAALTLVRVSQWPLSDAERALVEPDEFHCRIDPPAVARLIAGCDLMLAPSWEQEGFGLPVLEAMACGVPVGFRIQAFAGLPGAASWCRPAYGRLRRRGASDPRRPRWREMRRAGLQPRRPSSAGSSIRGGAARWRATPGGPAVTVSLVWSATALQRAG